LDYLYVPVYGNLISCYDEHERNISTRCDLRQIHCFFPAGKATSSTDQRPLRGVDQVAFLLLPVWVGDEAKESVGIESRHTIAGKSRHQANQLTVNNTPLAKNRNLLELAKIRVIIKSYRYSSKIYLWHMSHSTPPRGLLRSDY